LVEFGWQWVFWFNLPLGALCTLWAAVVLREMSSPDAKPQHDPLGNVLCLIGLTGLVLGLSDAGLDGWSAPMVIAGLAAAAVFIPLFLVVERRVRAPMLDLSLFRMRIYSAAAAAAFLNGLARFA